MALALESTDCGLTIQAPNLEYRFVTNLPAGLVRQTVNLQDFEDVIDDVAVYGNLLGEKLKLAKLALDASGETQRLSTLSGNRVISFAMSNLTLTDGTKRIVTVVQDITKARQREATMRTLLLELSHRSKNLLAIIQGLATQSAKNAASIGEFLQSFIGRLHAVSGAQDLIVETNWQKASLHELARRQLQAVSTDRDTRVEFSGADLELDPNQSLHIGLALYELAMTSSMAKSSQRKTIRIEAGSDQNAFIQWQSEPGIEKSNEPANFGKTLLEKIVPSALAGKSLYEINTGSLNWRVDFPLNIQKRKRHPTERSRTISEDPSQK